MRGFKPNIQVDTITNVVIIYHSKSISIKFTRGGDQIN